MSQTLRILVLIALLATCGSNHEVDRVKATSHVDGIDAGVVFLTAHLTANRPEIDRVRDMGVPSKFSPRQENISAYGTLVIVTCNDPQAHAFGMFRCASSFLVASGANMPLFFGDDGAWHLTTDIIAMYSHSKSLGPALAKQGQWTEFVGLAPYDAASDKCGSCELNNPTSPTDCYRAVVNDDRAKRLWFIPCRGEPRWEPQ